jgi:hypothetical protein
VVAAAARRGSAQAGAQSLAAAARAGRRGGCVSPTRRRAARVRARISAPGGQKRRVGYVPACAVLRSAHERHVARARRRRGAH